MATLYWGGGSGTWDGFTTTRWYTDVARTVLAGRAPAADDDVIFDSSSHTTNYTVTISNETTVCRSCTISGPASGTLTLAGSGSWYIYGDLTLPATGFSRTYSGNLFFYATDSRTITTNGVAFTPNSFIFNGSGTYTLQDALTVGQFININAGTFNTNSKTVSVGLFGSASSITGGTLSLGASTISLYGGFVFRSPVTVNGGTSNVTIDYAGGSNYFIGASSAFTGGTFYNVTVNSGPIGEMFGNNTFNNLTFPALSSAAVQQIYLYGNQTINGTLTMAGSNGSARYFVQSNTIGTARTLTVATVGTLTDVDFRDITIAGASSPWSGTRLGDCKGNTNITFDAPKTVYIAAGTNDATWANDIWATSSGGSAAIANFPLAQDTIIIDNAGLNTTAILYQDKPYNTGTFNASSRTNAATLSIGGGGIYGDINVSANVTISVNGGYTFAGRTTQNITSNGKTLPAPDVNSPGGTVKYLDAFNSGNNPPTLTQGTYDFNNQNHTSGQITAVGSASKTLTLGSGTITTTFGITSSTTISNLTVTANTASIVFNTFGSSASLGFEGITATFGGSVSYTGTPGSLTIRGTTTVSGTVTITGASNALSTTGDVTIGNLTIATAPTNTGVTTKLFLAGNLTVTGTLALAGGTSVTQRASVLSNTLGTQRTLSAATVTGLSDIDFRDINATGAANWTTGTRLGDCGNNAGITFDAAKTVYWNLSGTQNWSATAWATGSGGTPAVNNFPLAQDTAVFDNTGAVGTVTMNAAWNIGTISAGGRTSAWTLTGTSGSPVFYGDIVFGSGLTMTTSSNQPFQFSGRGTQTYTTAGKTLTNNFTVNKPAGTFQHGDAYTTTATSNISITAGGYTTQNYNISTGGINSSNTNTRSITFGTSTLTLSSTATPINFATSTGLTFSGASSTINLSSASNKTFGGGEQTFGTVSVTGGTTSNTFTITGNNKFGTLTNTARNYLIFPVGSTQEITTFTYSGASGSVVRWYTNTPGQRATIKTTSSAVGANSTNGGNNDGLTFTGSSPNYFYVKDIAYSALAVAGTANFLMFFN